MGNYLSCEFPRAKRPCNDSDGGGRRCDDDPPPHGGMMCDVRRCGSVERSNGRAAGARGALQPILRVVRACFVVLLSPDRRDCRPDACGVKSEKSVEAAGKSNIGNRTSEKF